MQRFFDDEGKHFAVLISLGFAYAGLADAGEVLSTIERVPEGDNEAWIREWSTTAERLETEANDAMEAGHDVSARTRFLRAATYFDHASAASPGSTDPSRFTSLWERHRRCWDQAVDRFEVPVERVQIPYEDTTLAGYLFKPAGAGQSDRRPTIILNNGSDGPIHSQWSMGGRAAVARGWNAITFDGPGQGQALHHQHLYFRHDWEAVITPVIDFLVARSDVDPDRIALQGISQGGYWAPRAAAFEPRIGALVADPGVVRVASSWEMHMPPELVAMLDDPANQADFDALMAADPDPERKAMLAWRCAPYGTASVFQSLVEARKMTLDDETIARIQCPTAILDPDHEQFWPGQPQQLLEKLTCDKRLIRFIESEGSDWHCEPAAQSLRDERVFDFLEDVLG